MAKHERQYDVVIVGSGAGGGAVAAELADLCGEGLRIAVLEWGPKLRMDEYTGREVEMADKLYFDSGGVLTKDGAMTLAFGRLYGGSTVVYTGTSLRIPAEVVDRWGVPGLDHADLMERSAKYLEQNSVHLQDEVALNDNNRLFRAGCQAAGFRVEQFPVNLKGCSGTSLCNLGCPNGAKQGTHRVQLPAAEAAGVEVITNCRVTRVTEGGVEAVVASPGFGEPSLWEDGEYTVSARAVVVAGGTVNSPALLLRSGLGPALPQLGRYLTMHPALILVGEHDEPISNFNGHPKSFFCDEFWRSHGFLLETCMYFPFTTAKNLIGFGAEHAGLMAAFPRLQMILVLAVDDALASNRVELDRDGEPVVDYRLTEKVLDSLHASMHAAARIFFGAGARRIHAPAGTRFFIDRADADRIEELIPRRLVKPGRISVTSAHLMGGCRMGAGPEDSVTDAWGRVHGRPGLYVADGSLFPKASEINPYVTIMALADRVAEAVRGDLPRLEAR
jgi:long-chain-alcohol oxidase